MLYGGLGVGIGIRAHTRGYMGMPMLESGHVSALDGRTHTC
jgi:hypothetical protein